MEYAILDQLQEYSEPKRNEYQTKNNVIIPSHIEELNEAFNGSSEKIRVFLYKNYFTRTDPIDLLIIIREEKGDEKNGDGFSLAKVEQAVFPLYNIKPNSFDLPTLENPPDLHPDIIKFIVEKRSLPKKKYNEGEFDPEKHKWNVNLIANALNINNRAVADYCRIKNIWGI